MAFRQSVLPCLLLALSLGSPMCLAQSVEAGGATTRKLTLRPKLAIERHFESLHPRPRPTIDGAVPGSALLEEHRLRAANMETRVRASLAALPEVSPLGAPLPGILLRDSIPAGSLPTSVVTGDFNRDGHMDFVVANGLTNDLWIYLGKGDGTFELPQIIPLSKGLSPVGLAVGDFRGNGYLDLVVAEADSSTIGVLPGNGDGTFGYEQEYALPEPPASVVVDDFNHDGKMDIAAVMVTTGYPGATIPYIALLTGDGTGKFGTPIITNSGFYSTAWNIASGDVNGDGLPDLLITGPGNENAQVFLNNGDGTFKAGAIVIANDPGVGLPFILDGRLADINGDGCADAVAADLNTMVWVSLGDCSGNFTKPVAFYMGANNAAVRLADVNGDGHLDLVTAALPGYSGADLGAFGGNSLNVALGDGKGNFGTARTYEGTSQAYSIGIADFNGDGKPDFVTANNDTDTVTVYQNDGTGGFGFPQGIYAGVPGQGAINAPRSSLSFADLNNDGKMDAFFLDTGISGEYYATGFLNDGTGKLTGPISSDTGVSITTNVVGDHRLGDFRNIGTLDLVAIGPDQAGTNSTSYILFLAGNRDGTFAKGTPVLTTGANGIMAVGDFNKDGKLDFVSVNGRSSHALTTFLGNGNGTFQALAPITFSDTGSSTGGTNAMRAYTGDFNRDGKLDVLVFTSGNGYFTTESTVWEFDGNGDGTFQSPRQLFTGFEPFALADVNGDGFPDIARYDFMWPDGTTQTEGPSKFTTYLGQADGSFIQSSTYAPYAGIPESVQPFAQNGDPLSSSLVADFNGDGKPEEVAFQASALGASAVVYAQFLMGNGDGTFTPTYDIFPFYGGYPLYARDLDGDGIADMLELDGGTSSLRFYKGGYAPALQMELEQPVVIGNSGCGWVFPDVASSSSQIVTLSSSIAGVLLPTSVTLSPGALSAKFCYSLASNFNWRQVFDINAQLSGDTATAYASDSYVLGFTEVVSPATQSPLYAGQSTAPLTLTLTSSQGYSSTANLYCEGLSPGDSCQFGSNTLNVSPAVAATTTVTLVTGPNSAAYGTSASFTIVADDGNVIQRQTVTVGVASLRLSTLGVASVTAFSPGSSSLGLSVWGIPPYQFSCSGLPAGAMCSFSGNQLAYPSSSGINATVNLPPGIATGSYPFTVNAASQTYTASGSLTLQVVGYSVQGPPATNSWLLAGTTQTVTVTVQGSSNWNGAGQVTISCSLDVAATCTGGSVYPGVTTASPLRACA